MGTPLPADLLHLVASSAPAATSTYVWIKVRRWAVRGAVIAVAVIVGVVAMNSRSTFDACLATAKGDATAQTCSFLGIDFSND